MNTRQFLLTASEIEAMVGEEKIHFLNPNAQRINKSLGDAVGLNHMGVHMIYVEPGRDTTEYHLHHYEEESIYVLSGSATAVIGGDRYKVGAGDFIGLPRHTVAHNVINDGEQTLVCLVMGQRLAQDVSDYPDRGQRLYRNNGEWNLVAHESITDPRKK